MSGSRWGALALGLAAMIAGCHASVRVPMLGIGPLRANDPTLYDDALSAVRNAGHPAAQTDPEHGRFTVRASSDPHRETVFVVQCSRDGFITVMPEGASVVRTGDTFAVWPALRTEWAEIVMAIERSVPETR